MEHLYMKKHIRRIVPFLLVIGIIASVGWYLLVYDRAFTRDVLLEQARFYDMQGHDKVASFFYDLAYEHTGQDDSVAIELANQYIADGNYTKAEQTLTSAIADGGTADLYMALCKTFVQQDKLQDAVAMLNNIADPSIKAELDAKRPAAPSSDPAPGFYSQYISVNITAENAQLYCTTNGEYPSIEDAPLTDPIALSAGETKIYALSVAENGLVSPLTILGYTIGGVIEEAVFADPAMEASVRELLGVDADQTLMTNQLWEIKEFTVPAQTQVFDDLALLPYVEKLTIQDQKLDTLAYLSSLSALTELNLTGCRFPSEDLSILAGLPKLTHLTLAQCGLSTLADLSGAQNLTHLNLNNNTLQNLEPISSMNTLVEISLGHNALITLNALSSLTNLENLDISYNSVSDLSPLASCVSLKWLNAGNNSISKLSGVDSLSGLTFLRVDQNQISDLSILSGCAALTELNVSNNALTDISPLSSLSALQNLDFSYNQVETLPAWADGNALNTVNGSYNKLTSIDSLKNAENLSYVYMDYNQLTSINALAGCYHLVMVNVYGNEIKDVSALTEHDIIVNYNPVQPD